MLSSKWRASLGKPVVKLSILIGLAAAVLLTIYLIPFSSSRSADEVQRLANAAAERLCLDESFQQQVGQSVAGCLAEFVAAKPRCEQILFADPSASYASDQQVVAAIKGYVVCVGIK